MQLSGGGGADGSLIIVHSQAIVFEVGPRTGQGLHKDLHRGCRSTPVSHGRVRWSRKSRRIDLYGGTMWCGRWSLGAAAPGGPAVTANAGETPREERSSTAENDNRGELSTKLFMNARTRSSRLHNALWSSGTHPARALQEEERVGDSRGTEGQALKGEACRTGTVGQAL